MLADHVRYYLHHITGKRSEDKKGGSVLSASAEIRQELQKLEDLQLCYQVLCKITTGTDDTISEEGLSNPPAEYNNVVEHILDHFSQPPTYDESPRGRSAYAYVATSHNHVSKSNQGNPTLCCRGSGDQKAIYSSEGATCNRGNAWDNCNCQRRDTDWMERIRQANERAAFI